MILFENLIDIKLFKRNKPNFRMYILKYYTIFAKFRKIQISEFRRKPELF